MNVFLIKNGIIENCISADSVERALQFFPDYICLERPSDIFEYGIGDFYDGASFSKAPPKIPEVLPITRLDFLRRFTAAQRIAIRSANDPIITDALQMLDLASEVSLDDEDVIMFVGYIQQQGFITQEEAAKILEVV